MLRIGKPGHDRADPRYLAAAFSGAYVCAQSDSYQIPIIYMSRIDKLLLVFFVVSLVILHSQNSPEIVRVLLSLSLESHIVQRLVRLLII